MTNQNNLQKRVRAVKVKLKQDNINKSTLCVRITRPLKFITPTDCSFTTMVQYGLQTDLYV